MVTNIAMPIFITPGPLCSSSSQFKALGSQGNRDLAHPQLRPGPICASSTYEPKRLSLVDEVNLSPLQFTSGKMCRRDEHLLGFLPTVEKEKTVLVAVIVGGLTSTNPFGHVAIAIEGYGTFSYGTDTPAGTGLSDYLAKQGGYRSSVVYSIETTEARAQLIAARAKSFVGKKLPDPTKDPRGFADTCATRTIKALEAGGYSNPKPTLFGSAPSMFPRDAENYGREYGTQLQLKKGDTVPDIFKKFQKKD
ncbi:hypothetical protein [Diaphorobacter aerolatus]|uniref:DUF4105 domain-containing protein n=1 Tax=Diaphorobacter aerolatus TaxID=1288495 RepID=A0A7H0GHW6_9BURK|nr:hypothetical protein [Diaphorobacter aerolatus]QNP47882.1 hypothetical protein H9K75_17360 [Diaphorobacter aerolatus]